MVPERSLPCSLGPATSLCPEPYKSTLWPQSSLLKIYFNIILPSTPKSSKWPLSLKCLTKPLYAPLLCPHTCYIPRPSPTYWFDQPNNIWWRAQIMRLLIVQFPPLPGYLVLVPNSFLNTLLWDTVTLCFSLNMRSQVSRPYKTTDKL